MEDTEWRMHDEEWMSDGFYEMRREGCSMEARDKEMLGDRRRMGDEETRLRTEDWFRSIVEDGDAKRMMDGYCWMRGSGCRNGHEGGEARDEE